MNKYALLAVITILLLGILVHFRIIGPGSGDSYAWRVRQTAQLHSIDTGVELFRNEWGGYPPSDANDPTGSPYCGAMKLTEAVVGQDLVGFHSESVFRRDGLGSDGKVDLYPDDIAKMDPSARANLKVREGPYLPIENARPFRLADVYGKGQTGPFPGDLWVLCDVFEKKRPSRKKTGMPILYYLAHPDREAHDVNDPDNPENIYDYKDNQALIALGVPGDPGAVHSLLDPRSFYKMTRNLKIDTTSTPYRADTYILLSAGYDGQYGTADDVFNFPWKYRE